MISIHALVEADYTLLTDRSASSLDGPHRADHRFTMRNN